jgi:hypothetical protein
VFFIVFGYKKTGLPLFLQIKSVNGLSYPVNGWFRMVKAVFAFEKALTGQHLSLIERNGALAGYSCKTSRDWSSLQT